MMDLREAKACLDEYSVSLATTCAMLKPNVAQGELGETIEKLNGSFIKTLDVHIREAVKLCIIIQRGMNARRERMLDFTREEADVLVALDRLRLATNKAAEARAEYLRKAAVKETETPNRVAEAIKEFKRRNSDSDRPPDRSGRQCRTKTD